MGIRRQARRRAEHRSQINADGVSSKNTKSLGSAGGARVGKDDLDVGTEHQAARLGRLEDAREDSGPSQEVRFRVPGSVVQNRWQCRGHTGEVHHRVR